MKPIEIEILTIGEEILIGQTINTNAAWIGEKLNEIGLKVHRHTTITDNKEIIKNTLSEIAQRSDVILITGGLGATSDDVTKKALCEYFNVGVVRNENVLTHIREIYLRRNRALNAAMESQADLPTNCTCIFNSVGVAPGMWFEENGTIYVSMPGVPYEMKEMMQSFVLPELKKRFAEQVIYHHRIWIASLGESYIAEKLEKVEKELPQHIQLAYLPQIGIVQLRFTAVGSQENELKKQCLEIEKEIRSIFGDAVVGVGDNVTLQGIVGEILQQKKLTISTAESCTGGYVAHLITSVPGSSVYFKGSIVSYDTQVKIAQLNVNPKDIAEYSVVSEKVAIQMAEGVRKRLQTDVAISTTGIAGPDGGTTENPVGTVWIGYADKDISFAKRFVFEKDRLRNIQRAALMALDIARKHLVQKHGNVN
ncbi:MAG: competence/damage-inducible protein A [Bacteroidia bacterium]|nr:competence/damage-inducible protein A [Bacteroidia bacterium]MDW8301783.1 competence/damage-inducible protein A [Bacteroidia bacterium]